MLEAYGLGIRSFDSALGGVGGNPSAIDSVGNIATESLVQFFSQMGIETGIDINAFARPAPLIVYRIDQLVGDPPPASRTMRDSRRSRSMTPTSHAPQQQPVVLRESLNPYTTALTLNRPERPECEHAAHAGADRSGRGGLERFVAARARALRRGRRLVLGWT